MKHSGWHIFRVMVVWLLAMIGSYLAAAVPHDDAVPAYAEEQTILQLEKDQPEPGWWSLASGRMHFDRHSIAAQGQDPEHVVIVQRGGNTWRVIRNGPLALASGTLLLLVPLAIFVFYRKIGPAPLGEPVSGKRVQRFTRWQRYVHWSTAITFVILAVTGLLLLFGKVTLLPLVGHQAFSWFAVIAKYVHNFVGPVFIACSVALFVTFFWQNLLRKWDWNWIKRGGGLVSHEHVPAGYFNAGEKLWFWGGLVFLGLIMSMSGLLLNFPNFGQTRYLLQLADYLHIGGAALYIVGAMGHSYIGSVGNPGSFDAMRHGTVDEVWAKVHHRYWYEDIKHGRSPAALDPLLRKDSAEPATASTQGQSAA